MTATATAAASSSADNDGIATTSVNSKAKALHLAWIPITEGSASFAMNTPIRGDILMRCRHANGGDGAERVSMFRAAFHTGYVPSGVLRLTKEQLDGPAGDDRFDEDFFIDLIFAPVVKASSSTSSSNNTTPSTPDTSTAAGVVTPSATTNTNSNTNSAPAVITTAKRITDEGLEIIESSDKYEESLHKDKRFWDSIASRKQKTKKRRSRKFDAEKTEHFIIDESESNQESNMHSESGHGGHGDGGELGDDGVGDEGESKPRLGISDEDLLAQLAYAEELLGDHEDKPGSIAGSMGGGGSIGGSVSGVDVDGKSDSMKDYLVVDDVSDRSGMVLVDSGAVGSIGSNTNPPSTPMNKELEALEALERELGLDLNIFSTPTPTKSNVSDGVTGGVVADDGDSLEDLEKYLQSINEK